MVGALYWLRLVEACCQGEWRTGKQKAVWGSRTLLVFLFSCSQLDPWLDLSLHKTYCVFSLSPYVKFSPLPNKRGS